MMSDTTSVIEDFLDGYTREKDFYERISRHAAAMCETELTRSGIQATIKWRAKEEKSLRNKLMQRNPVKKYDSVRSIRNDIVDLAGVRIALYFPNHIKKTEDIIQKIFNIHETIQHGDESPKTDVLETSKPYVARFSGYKGKHFRVSIREEQRSHVVEIQITSMLHHTWAQVGHDLVYKQMSGLPSVEEERILDGLGGLIQVGEVLLEQLHDVYQTRSQSQNIKFANQYELGSFLLSRRIPSGLNMGPLETLLRFLAAAGYNSPNKLLPIISELESRQWESNLLNEALQNAGLNKAESLKPSLSVLIMEAILAQADVTAILKTKEDGQKDSDVYKFQCMAGAIILLDELFPPMRAWAKPLFLDNVDTDLTKMECSKWLSNVRIRPQEVVNGQRNLSKEERENLDAPWTWFLSQQNRAIDLAFRASKLGVVSNFGPFSSLRIQLSGELLMELPFEVIGLFPSTVGPLPTKKVSVSRRDGRPVSDTSVRYSYKRAKMENYRKIMEEEDGDARTRKGHTKASDGC